MKNDLSGVKVGDYVWTIQSGWCVVLKNNSLLENTVYLKPSIKPDFPNYYYTLDGKFYPDDTYPSAFLEPPACFNAEPKPCKFKKGDRVLVSNVGKPELKRYFSHKNSSGKYSCFIGGQDEWTSNGVTSAWDYCKAWED